ncbi:MarR family winged helix-turn-helix transcriptional regulator [Streptomyces sp. NPDC057067]|uniref:MarR family transcriptional regulator n=3 Tax=Streptomyces TaxID=1883 RepID=A0A652KWM7_9ACTN|nr:MarR family transcriptional regulator [Streptomyces silvae]RPK47402.1 MarR family protein [Streptomyces sp. ADI93-02]TXS28041.1 MarR family transcriptional regulator [Streptomyces sp. gb1(2016)]
MCGGEPRGAAQAVERRTVDKPTHLIEFETMLLGRHLQPGAIRSRRGGHLDRSAYTLLSRIRMEGPMSIGQLSEAFGLDASTLNRQTAAMLRAGLVERIPDPDGGIARKFRITGAGERGLDAEREANISGLERVMAEWSPDEVADFAAYLKRFNSDIEHLDGRPWPRP